MNPQKSNCDTIRRQAKLQLYIANGAKRLFHNPLIGLLALLLLTATFVTGWGAAYTFAVLMAPLFFLVDAIKWLARILLFILTMLLVAGFLYLIGIPYKAREIENDLATAFKVSDERSYCGPFLVSRRPIKGTSAIEYIFWTRWIPLDQWNKTENKKAVLWALNSHSDKDFESGRKKYTVVIVAASGITPKERETPKDPLFM